MTVAELLATLRERGVTLVAAGNCLRYRPAAPVTAEERAALVRHRGAVLECLRDEREAAIAVAVEVFGAWVSTGRRPAYAAGAAAARTGDPAPESPAR
jgi:tubulysin polyketide synthase-like protein